MVEKLYINYCCCSLTRGFQHTGGEENNREGTNDDQESVPVAVDGTWHLPLLANFWCTASGRSTGKKPTRPRRNFLCGWRLNDVVAFMPMTQCQAGQSSILATALSIDRREQQNHPSAPNTKLSSRMVTPCLSKSLTLFSRLSRTSSDPRCALCRASADFLLACTAGLGEDGLVR